MINCVALKAFCINRPNFDEDAFFKFLDSEDLNWIRRGGLPAEELVEVSGRVCYLSFGKERQSPRNNSEYVKNLIAQGHESVLEHVNWTIILTGISRGFTHQLVRHRVGFAYSQLSQQYHDDSEASFVAPPSVENNKELFECWKKDIEKTLQSYRNILLQAENTGTIGISDKEKNRELRTAARSVLPNATETKIVVTANARALRHFFQMRGSLDGDWEMRKVACALYDIVIEDAPSLFSDFNIKELEDNSRKLIKA